MRDDQLRFLRDCTDGAVRHGDILVAVLLELLAQCCRTECRRAHARITGVDDDLQILARNLLLCGQLLAAILALCHVLTRRLQRVVFDILRHLDKDRSNRAGYRRRYGKCRKIGNECRGVRGHRDNREDRARRGRSNQTAAEEAERKDAGHAARNRGDDEDRLHEDVREVDLVNTAEYVDNHGSRRGRLSHALAKHPVGEQNTKAGPGVRLEQEEHGLAVFLRLLNAEGAEHAMIQCIVEEEHLCGLNDDGCQRQKSCRDNRLHAAAQDVVCAADHGADHSKGNHCEDTAEDAEREVVDEHLESSRDAVTYGIVKLLDQIATQRSHNHGAEEHRNLRARDDARCGNRRHDAATVSVDCCAAAVADQQRDKPLAHRTADLCQILVWHPSRRNKECR